MVSAECSSENSMQPTKICVFCSTMPGASPAHLAAARSLAQVMHDRSIQLIYGAGTTGMMGELAKTLVALSGPDSVLGIIPTGILDYERPEDAMKDAQASAKLTGKKGLLEKWGFKRQSPTPPIPNKSTLQQEEIFGRVIVVSDMQVRKKRMAQEVASGARPGSGFIGLSGGFGTMDELMEVVTWNQLGVHKMGVCLYNVEGYWDGVLSWLDHAIQTKFVRESARDIMVAKETAEDCIEWLKGYSSRDQGLNMTWSGA